MASRSTTPGSALRLSVNAEMVQGVPADFLEETEEQSCPFTHRRTNVDGDSTYSSLGDRRGQVNRENMEMIHCRREDGYIPGSIVRIQLKNFVTYDYIQFFPGTHLNIIIGPKGTRRSSIASAIVLGLNFPPSVLGRATVLGSFAKHGAEKGYIEIELKGPKGIQNLVIRRHLQSDSTLSSFTLNGSPATGAEIKNTMVELNFQVGNLCSFLPQDRVTEFAAMSPQELLRETQRVASDENLTSWHDNLISAGKNIREIQQKIRDEENALSHMKERNEGIESEVRWYKDRKKIEYEIALLNVLVPAAEHRESRTQYLEMKTRQRNLHDRVQALKENNTTAHELLSKMEQELKGTEKQRDDLKAATQAKLKELALKNKASERLKKESSKWLDQLRALNDEENTRLRQIRSLTTEIKKLQEEVDNTSPYCLSSEEDFLAEVEQINLERQSTVLERRAFDLQLKVIIEKAVMANVTLSNTRKELAKLDDADAQKLASMAKWDYTTYQGILWVRENRNLFKMEVYETPFMRITVKDKIFVNAIESTLWSEMKTFVTQCEEDCNTLNRLINDEERFGKGKKVTTWFRPNLAHLHVEPPMTQEELTEQHFDGYAMDYVDFPEGMRWFLESLQFHRTAIAHVGDHINVGQVIELVGRPIRNHSGGATFYAGMSSYSITRSRYGIKALITTTSDVKPARNLTSPIIDLDAQRRIQEEIQKCETELGLCKEEKRRIHKEIDRLIIEDSKFTQRLDNVKQQRKDIMTHSRRLQSAKARLNAKGQCLANLKNEPPVDHKKEELKANLNVNATKLAELAKEYTNLLHVVVSEQGKCTEAGLRCLQINANKAAADELCLSKEKKYRDALALFVKVDNEFKAIKARAKESLQQSRKILEESTDEVKAACKRLAAARTEWEDNVKNAQEEGKPTPTAANAGIENRDVEELRDELEAQKAKLEMGFQISPGIIKQYEKRKSEIEVLEKSIEEEKRKEIIIAKDIKDTKDNWQPALQSLVNRIGAKFSAAFNRIGCTGEICISQLEDEDYEKWAIDIFVKFRDSDRLQLLTPQRQSGGERSLTTTLYLLSLTEEIRAPFSLVDEINQGMDQRTERAVYNSIVNISCQADSAQYFLITPKLLSDLEYHDRMKILCE